MGGAASPGAGHQGGDVGLRGLMVGWQLVGTGKGVGVLNLHGVQRGSEAQVYGPSRWKCREVLTVMGARPGGGAGGGSQSCGVSQEPPQERKPERDSVVGQPAPTPEPRP